MHFLVIFALIGICIMVAPVVIEATLLLALAIISLIALVAAGALMAEIGWWSLLGFVPPLLFAGGYWLEQHLLRRRVVRQQQAIETVRRHAERDLAQRVARATARFRAIAH